MSLFTKTLLFSNIARLHVVPLAKYSISTGNIETFNFKSNFSEEEQTKILNILNGSDTSRLSRFHISQNRIKSIESWKNKKGQFRSLSEVLEVDGLGEKLLQKMCEDIVHEKCDNSSDQITSSKSSIKNKRYKQILIPTITGQTLNNITSAVGIHLSSVGVSWAKLFRDQNKLISWNYDNFGCLPNKMLPNDTFDKAYNILNKIPPSDVYIFEANQSMGPQGQGSTSLALSYIQQLELNSMLLALLNTSQSHNVTLKDSNDEVIENRVFYLRSRISARLFSTLMGQEKVAAISTINELLQGNEGLKKDSLPCTPITAEQSLKSTFHSQSSANKELLGQALMLIITFMDLCVYKNPLSLSVVYNKNKKNKT